MKNFHLTLALLAMASSCAHAAPNDAMKADVMKADAMKFSFGAGTAAPGTLLVAPDTSYSAARGYGFEPGSTVVLGEKGAKKNAPGFLTSDKPFYFSVALPEGNYNVSLTLGSDAGASDTTVKAESRRLMLEKVATLPGQFVTRTFTVNIRDVNLKAGGQVRLKEREKSPSYRHWDDKLTLEFNGPKPCVAALDIAPAPDAVTVYLAGDSTVTDQTAEPWNSWGQNLPRFFKAGVAVANHAESGETLASFYGEKRFEKIFDTIKKGDYLFIQFGHNDMKYHGEGAGGMGNYLQSLKRAVTQARAVGAIPVVITPMNRRTFDLDGKVTNSLEDFPDAVRKEAADDKVALIDLNAMSKVFYEAMGPQNSTKAFVHYAANTFPGQTVALKDNTHFNAYGGYELARCIVEGIRSAKLDLAAHLTDDAKPFDPAHPDDPATFVMPQSVAMDSVKPDGN